MKKIFAATFVIFAITNVFGWEVSDKLLDAIEITESNKKASALGDYSTKTKEYRAVGSFQIWKIYVDDVNRFSKKKYSYDDRKNASKSREIVKAYLLHYGKRYKKLTGEAPTDEVLSRIHNGGPNGYKKGATLKYWNKVKANMSK